MELKELCDKTLAMFGVQSVDDLGDALMVACRNADDVKIAEFADMVEDLSMDWLQMIYQYYQADRKFKKQDFTPKSLAKLCGRLIGDDTDVIDMCAGSGAMTIQKWNMNHDATFTLYEIDKNAIPYLAFNMVLRNIDCTICHNDVLTNDSGTLYKITKGERFGKLEVEENVQSDF